MKRQCNSDVGLSVGMRHAFHSLKAVEIHPSRKGASAFYITIFPGLKWKPSYHSTVIQALLETQGREWRCDSLCALTPPIRKDPAVEMPLLFRLEDLSNAYINVILLRKQVKSSWPRRNWMISSSWLRHEIEHCWFRRCATYHCARLKFRF